MNLRPGVLWKIAGVAIITHAGCSIEDHPLSYGTLSEGSSTGRAEAGSTMTSGTAGQTVRSELGGSPGEGGAPTHDGGAESVPSASSTDHAGTSGGGSSDAGSGGSSAGGSSAGGSSVGGSTSAGGGGSASGTGGANFGGAGSGGSAGTASSGNSGSGGVVDSGPCGDADRNGVQDCQETLAKNATFDRDINGWSPDLNVTQTWLSDDAWKQPSSGSLSLIFTTPAGGQGWVAAAVSQCLPGWTNQQFELGAHAFVADGQSGTAQISLAMFGNDGCAGSFLGTTTAAVTAITGSWQSLHASVELEPGTRSVLVRLGAAKPGTQSSLEVRFDDVLVRMK